MPEMRIEMYLLEMNHIKKSFDGLGVIDDISLSVKEGEKMCIRDRQWSRTG